MSKREILFRGKQIVCREWVYGSLVILKLEEEDVYHISDFAGDSILRVIPETVGQYTGLEDKNGVKIFEGDIIRNCKSGHLFLVKWYKTGLTTFQMTGMQKVKEEDRQYIQVLYDAHKHEVIGNIHDNPGFLEAAE